MIRRRPRAVLVLKPALDPLKQQALMLRWAAEHRYDVTSITYVPTDAAALVEAGFAEAVVIITHTRATLEMAGRVGLLGVTVDELRPSQNPLRSTDSTRTRILDAARRGVPAESIALVLDIPVATVHEALGITAAQAQRPRDTSRRPRLVTGPPGRP